MAEILAPDWAVPLTTNQTHVTNQYGDAVETDDENRKPKTDIYKIDAPDWAVPIKDISDEESEIDLHNNISRKPDIPKTWFGTGKSYDELNPEGWGAWVYGWNQSQEGMYELLNNIPGSVDRFFDWVGETTGLDKDDEGFFEEAVQNLEYWLTKRARLTNPEYLGLEAPETLRGKVMAGFAAAPITVGSYVPASYFLGPVGGFALTDAIRAAEPDAGLLDIAEGAAWGAVYGKTLKWAQNYNLIPRMSIMGSMGFGGTWIQTAGLEPPAHLSLEEQEAWKNSLSQDRIANAIVMMGLGVPGRYRTGMPFVEGIKKEIPGMKTKVELNREQLHKDLEDIKIAIERGEYNIENKFIDGIIKGTAELKESDLQIVQNVKDFAENIKIIDEMVAKDVAKEKFSEKQFINQVKRNAKKYGILEAQEYFVKFTEAKKDFTKKPLNKILGLSEKNLDKKVAFSKIQITAKKVEPKTETFNKNETQKNIYSQLENYKTLFIDAEKSMQNKFATQVLPIIKSLPKYKTYLKNLKKVITDTFGKEFFVYRLMDRSDFQKLAYSSKGIDKPLSTTFDAKIAERGSWVIGKSKQQRQAEAANQDTVFPGSLEMNDPVLVRIKVDSKSALFQGDKSLSELVIDGTKINVKNVEILKDNKGYTKRKLSESDKVKLEQYEFDLEVYLKNDTIQGLMKYRSILPLIEKLHQERGMWEKVQEGKYPKSEYDPKTGELKPLKETKTLDFNTHMNSLIDMFINAEITTKEPFIDFLKTLPKVKSNFTFPKEIHPDKSFMLVPWIRGILNSVKGKDRISNPDTQLLQEITKYLAKVDSVFKRDAGPHRSAMQIVRAAEQGFTRYRDLYESETRFGNQAQALNTLYKLVHGFKIIDWVLQDGKLFYKVKPELFKGNRWRNIPLEKETIQSIKENVPVEFRFETEQLMEVGKVHTEFKFEGKQGTFVGKLKGENWLMHQHIEFSKIIETLQKENRQNITLTSKLSEDPLDYKGVIPDPDWSPTLYGNWRIKNYEKGTNDYSNVITKAVIESVPKQVNEPVRTKVIELEDLKNVNFKSKEIDGAKTELITPDGQKSAIEQKRVENNVNEGGKFEFTTTKKRKKKLSKEELKKVKDRIEQINRMTNTAIATVAYTDKVAQYTIGKFRMGKYELLADLELANGLPKYSDISNMYLYTYPGWLLPSRMMKKHPALQYVAQLIGDHMNKVDRDMEMFLYNLQPKRLKWAEFDKEQKRFGGLFSTGKVPVGLTLLSREVFEPTAGGMLTRLNNIHQSKEVVNNKKGWERANDIIQTFFKVSRDKTEKAKEENLPYDIKNKDGTFRYEVTDAELKDIYKLDNEQILAYRDVRGALNTLVALYNDGVREVGMLLGISKKARINPIPNYIPNMFFGDARIFVNRKGQVDKAQTGEIKWEDLEVLRVEGKDNRASAELYVRTNKEFKKAFPNANIYVKVGKGERKLWKKGTGEYDVTVYMLDRELIKGTSAFEAVNQFAEGVRYLTIIGDIKAAKALKRAQEKLTAGRGFPVHRLKKQNIPGAMGEQLGTITSIKNVENFMKAMQAYTEGLLRTTHSWKFRRDTISEDGILQAKQMEHYPNTKVLINRMIENAMGSNVVKLDKVIHKLLRGVWGERGFDKFLGAANTFGLTTSLLFLNVRFLEAQAIQPYQMIIPKMRALIRQKKLFSDNPNAEGLLMDAVLRSQKRMYDPKKEDFEFVDFLHDQGVLEAKFFQEFLGKDAMSVSRITVGGKSFPVWNWAKNATMKSFVGRMESWSRLQAAMMFYHMFRLSGRSKKFSQSEAASLADIYMVQYALHDRPLLFGSAGMGTSGKPFGLFKTFQYNYLAQLGDHISTTISGLKRAKNKDQTWKEAWEDAQGSLYFLGSMVMTAGMFGVIGIAQADKILDKLFGFTLSQELAESDLPNYILWGIPSSVQGIDLTTTLAAPGLGAQDLFSVPALDKLGLNPLKWGENRGVIQAVGDVMSKVLDPKAFATRWEMQKMRKSIMPTSVHGIIEGYYSIKDPTPIVSAFTPWAWGELPAQSEHKEYGTFNREAKHWFARILASRDLEEARVFKTGYQLTLLDKRRNAGIDDLVAMGADTIMRGLYIPGWIFEEARDKWKVLPSELTERIKNKIESATTELTDRWVPKKVSGKYIMQKELLEGVMNKGGKYSGDGFTYHPNTFTNQIQAPEWAVPLQ